MLDRYLFGKATRLCPEGPVPVVAIDRVSSMPGGAANTAVNLAKLGAVTVSLLSVIGTDLKSSILQQHLIKSGVDTEMVIVDPERKTLAKQRIIANNQLVVRFDEGSTTTISGHLEGELSYLLRKDAALMDAVVVSDYSYGVCTLGLIKDLRNQFPVVVVDSKRLTAYRHLGPTAVKPNYAEAIALLNLPVVPDRVTQMRSQGEALLAATGAKVVVVTLDRDGALTFEAGQPPHHTPARPAPDDHAIGAGDTFVSALTLALAAGATGKEATAIASAATAVVVQSPGTTACCLSDLKSRLEQPL